MATPSVSQLEPPPFSDLYTGGTTVVSLEQSTHWMRLSNRFLPNAKGDHFWWHEQRAMCVNLYSTCTWGVRTLMYGVDLGVGLPLQVLHLKAAAPTLCRLSKCLCWAAGIVAGCGLGLYVGERGIPGPEWALGMGTTQKQATSTTSSNYKIHWFLYPVWGWIRGIHF